MWDHPLYHMCDVRNVMNREFSVLSGLLPGLLRGCGSGLWSGLSRYVGASEVTAELWAWSFNSEGLQLREDNDGDDDNDDHHHHGVVTTMTL